MPVEYLAMMVPFAGICAGMSIAFYAISTTHRRKMMDKQAAISTAQAKQNAVMIRDMQTRIQVLEKIVTDSGFDLAHRIEDLRERPNGNTVHPQQLPAAELR